MPPPRNNVWSGSSPPSYQSILHNEWGHPVPSRYDSPAERGYHYQQGENQSLLDDEGWSTAKPRTGIFKRHLRGIMGIALILIIGLQSTYIYANNDQWKEGRRQREQKEREEQRGMIQWGPLKKDEECLSYGTARYQAHLDYVPPLWDQRIACRETPIRIHRKDVVPTECHRNNETEIVGIWVVDFDEPACKPWWRDIKDHGCTSRGSGIHRYEGHLEGYLELNKFKANWAEMCTTTPHSMFGKTYDSPTECKYWPEIGVYGFWEVPDGQCL